MEPVVPEKKTKTKKLAPHSTIRVSKETGKRVFAEVTRANKKDYGRRISSDEIVSLALEFVTSEHITKLQEASLSHGDRLDRDYRAYVAAHGPLSKDDYLGKRLSGEIPAPEMAKRDSGYTEK